jgi:hypothetical protein
LVDIDGVKTGVLSSDSSLTSGLVLTGESVLISGLVLRDKTLSASSRVYSRYLLLDTTDIIWERGVFTCPFSASGRLLLVFLVIFKCGIIGMLEK